MNTPIKTKEEVYKEYLDAKGVKPKQDVTLAQVLGVIFLFVFFISIGLSMMEPAPGGTVSTTTASPFGSYEHVEVGDEATLWIEHESTTRGLVCLGTTQDDYDKVQQSLLSGDYLGIMEIAGAFCVGSGTKVQLVEKDFPLRRVRILRGAGEVDADKVGLSGWTAMEYVVK